MASPSVDPALLRAINEDRSALGLEPLTAGLFGWGRLSKDFLSRKAKRQPRNPITKQWVDSGIRLDEPDLDDRHGDIRLDAPRANPLPKAPTTGKYDQYDNVNEATAGIVQEWADRHGFQVTIRVEDRRVHADGPELFFMRTMKSKDEVHNDFLKIAKERQGGGLGSELDRELEDMYRHFGVKRISLDANMDVGGFSWTRAGYGFNPEYLRVHIPALNGMNFTARRVLRNDPDLLAQWDALYQDFHKRLSGDPAGWPSPLELAMFGSDRPTKDRAGRQLWPGKEIMLASRWEAVKYLQPDEGIRLDEPEKEESNPFADLIPQGNPWDSGIELGAPRDEDSKPYAAASLTSDPTEAAEGNGTVWRGLNLSHLIADDPALQEEILNELMNPGSAAPDLGQRLLNLAVTGETGGNSRKPDGGGLGQHWTADKRKTWVRPFSGDPVVQAEWRPESLETDPKIVEDVQGESEITMRRNAPLRITGLSLGRDGRNLLAEPVEVNADASPATEGADRLTPTEMAEYAGLKAQAAKVRAGNDDMTREEYDREHALHDAATAYAKGDVEATRDAIARAARTVDQPSDIRLDEPDEAIGDVQLNEPRTEPPPAAPARPGDIEPFHAEYDEEVDYAMREPNPPEKFWHVAPKVARQNIHDNGMYDDGHTWNTGAGADDKWEDDWLWSRGEDGEWEPFEYRPAGVYLWGSLEDAQEYAGGTGGDIYEIDTSKIGNEVIRDPNSAHNWDYLDPWEQTWVTRYVPPEALHIVEESGESKEDVPQPDEDQSTSEAGEIEFGAPRGDDDDGRGSHQPPDDGAPLYDLTDEEAGTFPDDVYDNPQYYMHTPRMTERFEQESLEAVRRARGNPDSMVSIFRAAPDHVQQFRTGDWVSLSKAYAEQHAGDQPGWHVIETKVPARDIRSGGNDLVEWGYWGDPVETQIEPEPAVAGEFSRAGQQILDSTQYKDDPSEVGDEWSAEPLTDAEGEAAGLTAPWLWTNATTGEQFIVKDLGSDPDTGLPQFWDEALAYESAASEFMQAIGLTRTPTTKHNGRISVTEFAGKDDALVNLDPLLDWADGRRDSAEWKNLVADLSDPEDVLRMSLADIAMGNTDRHGRNVLVGRDEDGETHLYPIDHNAAYPERGIDQPKNALFAGAGEMLLSQYLTALSQQGMDEGEIRDHLVESLTHIQNEGAEKLDPDAEGPLGLMATNLQAIDPEELADAIMEANGIFEGSQWWKELHGSPEGGTA